MGWIALGWQFVAIENQSDRANMSTAITEMMQSIGRAARAASRAMARATTQQKNQALLHIARLVREQSARILETNAVDV